MIIEKIIFNINSKTFNKCTIQTRSPSNYQAIVGINIAKRPLSDGLFGHHVATIFLLIVWQPLGHCLFG
jgi:hypothetical protein